MATPKAMAATTTGTPVLVSMASVKIKADNTQHDTAGKTQQQTDGPVGVLLQHGTDQTAKTGSGDTGQGGGDDQGFYNTHGFLSLSAVSKW